MLWSQADSTSCFLVYFPVILSVFQIHAPPQNSHQHQHTVGVGPNCSNWWSKIQAHVYSLDDYKSNE